MVKNKQKQRKFLKNREFPLFLYLVAINYCYVVSVVYRAPIYYCFAVKIDIRCFVKFVVDKIRLTFIAVFDYAFVGHVLPATSGESVVLRVKLYEGTESKKVALYVKQLSFLCHFFLLNLFINYVARCQLSAYVVYAYAHFDHQDHCVIAEVGKLVDGLRLIVCLGGDYNLG